jgi:hypothetical protein
MGSGKRHASSAVAARGRAQRLPPKCFLNRCYQKRKIAVLFYNPCMAEIHDRIREGWRSSPSLRWRSLTQNVKDVTTRIDRLQHAEKLLERATSFRLSGNESKSASEEEMNE